MLKLMPKVGAAEAGNWPVLKEILKGNGHFFEGRIFLEIWGVPPRVEIYGFGGGVGGLILWFTVYIYIYRYIEKYFDIYIYIFIFFV